MKQYFPYEPLARHAVNVNGYTGKVSIECNNNNHRIVYELPKNWIGV